MHVIHNQISLNAIASKHRIYYSIFDILHFAALQAT